jgi:hypothetical protein
VQDLLNNKNSSCSLTQQIIMYWCSSRYIRCNILDLLRVSTRVESSSGRELKEQIYFLDIESGFFVCFVFVCVFFLFIETESTKSYKYEREINCFIQCVMVKLTARGQVLQHMGCTGWR